MMSQIEHLYTYYHEAAEKVNNRDALRLWKEEVKICDLSEETKNNFCVLFESNDFREKKLSILKQFAIHGGATHFIRRPFFIGVTIIYDCI
jgi:hypothetical protein